MTKKPITRKKHMDALHLWLTRILLAVYVVFGLYTGSLLFTSAFHSLMLDSTRILMIAVAGFMAYHNYRALKSVK